MALSNTSVHSCPLAIKGGSKLLCRSLGISNSTTPNSACTVFLLLLFLSCWISRHSAGLMPQMHRQLGFQGPFNQPLTQSAQHGIEILWILDSFNNSSNPLESSSTPPVLAFLILWLLPYLSFRGRTQNSLHSPLGLSLEDIRSLLEVIQEGQPPCDNVHGLLQQKVALLDQRIAELTALRDALPQRLSWAETHPDPACDGQDHCVYLDSTPA